MAPSRTELAPQHASSVAAVVKKNKSQVSLHPNGNTSGKTTKQNLYPLPPAPGVKSVLPADLKTPDSHVPRDPRLVRLTGVHPFNCEAPLTDLYNQGFLTSEDLHFVRNHGHVPLCEDQDVLSWTFSIEGMVQHPFTITLRDLMAQYDPVTYPVTLVCAGNRRKEQNMVRKSKGFSWGPAGVSTALWTGVPIGGLLAAAKPARGARYVCFEGADKLPNGHYGTSVKLNWCMNAERGIMVAYKMNGHSLHPDHGKPVRMIIPGQIGGRSVKWLKRIIVTREPSDNWYHIYDNRVLPTMITPEASADLHDVWKDERYAIYDLNTNSAICYPQHDETLDLQRAQEDYKVRGYAYSGGGKRVTRLEVTLDKGRTWRLASITYPEDAYRAAPESDSLYGGNLDVSWRETSYCWCFWEIDIPISDLAEASDIMARAMDDSMMVQPRDMYWSVLGMMNNPWFRIVVHKQGDSISFEHPTQPGLMPGGWMERVKKAGGDLSNGNWGEASHTEQNQVAVEDDTDAKQPISMTNPEIQQEISIEQLEEHNNETTPWFVVNGQVYNGTDYLEAHPGGATSILAAAGQDCSDEFLAIHSENAKAMLAEYHVGTLSKTSQTSLASESAQVEQDKNRSIFLQPKTWNQAVLESKTTISHDSKIFRFRMDHPEQQLGLPVGLHILVRLRDPATRQAIIRAYTPTSYGNTKHTFEVVVKLYRSTPNYAGGQMTQALDSIPIGHAVDFKGPLGRFEYLGNGCCSLSGKKRHVDRFFMICAGSGITPILQVLRAVTEDKADKTSCLVLNGNRLEEDILCRAEIEAMVESASTRAQLIHTLSNAGSSWTGRRGRIDRLFLEARVGPPKPSSMVLLCGPKPLEESVQDVLVDMGWTRDDIVVF